VTNANDRPMTCKYPRCTKVLRRDNTSGFCSGHNNPESRAYADEATANKRKDNPRCEFMLKAHIDSVIYESYELEQRDGYTFIKGAGERRPKQLLSDNLLDFCQLADEDYAYLDYVKANGFLGLSALVNAEGMLDKRYKIFKGLSWHEDEEPLALVRAFHDDLKYHFELVNVYLDRMKESSSYTYVNDIIKDFIIPSEGEMDPRIGFMEFWFDDWFCRFARVVPKVRQKTSLVLETRVPAAYLVLQLYKYLVTGKLARKCALPSCQRLTLNKYCGTKHRNLARKWKERYGKGGMPPRLKAHLNKYNLSNVGERDVTVCTKRWSQKALAFRKANAKTYRQNRG